MFQKPVRLLSPVTDPQQRNMLRAELAELKPEYLDVQKIINPGGFFSDYIKDFARYQRLRSRLNPDYQRPLSLPVSLQTNGMKSKWSLESPQLLQFDILKNSRK
jgi:hypothetical protein